MTTIPANTANKGCLVKLTKMTPVELLTFIEEDRDNAKARGEPEPWKGVKEYFAREKEAETKKTEAKVRETREFLAEKAQVIAEHMYDVMKDENASIDLRRRAAEFIAEASMPKVAEAKATETPAKPETVTMEQLRNEALSVIHQIANGRSPASSHQYDAALYLIQYTNEWIRKKELRGKVEAMEAKTR
ncbi:hypothetical protein [Sinorhizobium meliloti]|uniref:hypothetical protein n=1 Tax=Rhizobium meliloti TaxID=382 RepID=UPI000FDA48AC|nr:hypothetical protein [Sinorhizobium meliloti]RVM19912.1 hypothetical protein CN134_02555 [Sinorhizobium meliloti]RVO31819.1 hypothetical protein CN098_11900 [Sinorhizobium meliloti]